MNKWLFRRADILKIWVLITDICYSFLVLFLYFCVFSNVQGPLRDGGAGGGCCGRAEGGVLIMS